MVNGLHALRLPGFAGTGRADNLWQTTCFELFVRNSNDNGYREFNFSPSQRWAAYRFEGYREGMAQLDLAAGPQIVTESGDELFVQTVWLARADVANVVAIGLCAVIEELNGRKSFWALAHGRDEPDFHDPACFALPVD